jgi:tRNA pseudouridine55 synthase
MNQGKRTAVGPIGDLPGARRRAGHPKHKPLCGILSVDKPAGMTSHDVVAALRKLSKQRKIGHAGTLDPMATGVLLTCLGDATRLSEYLMASPKTYQAAIYLGVSTATDDTEGEILRTREVRVAAPEIRAALAQFVGHIDQVPPSYSAIKRRGKRLYELARRGIQVQVDARPVDIYALDVLSLQLPLIEIRVHCGPGTYIRSLARDLGEALGCGAHLAALRRISSGRFTVDQAVSLEQIRGAFAAGTAAELLLPMDAALDHFPAIHLDAKAAHNLALGQAVDAVAQKSPSSVSQEADLARAYAPGGLFVAVVSQNPETGAWQPRKVLIRPEDIPCYDQQDLGDACAHQ